MKGVIYGVVIGGLSLMSGCQSTPSAVAPSAVGGEAGHEDVTVARARSMSGAAELLRGIEVAAAQFRAGEGERFARHYASDGVMVLSNGAILDAGALAGVAAKAGPGVERWELSNPAVRHVAHGAYAVGDSLTVMRDGGERVELQGQRLIAWGGGDAPLIIADLSIPAGELEVPPELAERARAYVNAAQARDVTAQRALFTEDGLCVISDGRSWRGEQLSAFFEMSAGMELGAFEVSPKRAWRAGQDVAFVSSEYAFDVHPVHGDATRVSGCRVEVWARTEEGWKIAVQISQPEGSRACL